MLIKIVFRIQWFFLKNSSYYYFSNAISQRCFQNISMVQRLYKV